jgi:hypothetical protein
MLVDRKRRLVEIRSKGRNALAAKFGADVVFCIWIPVEEEQMP